MSETTMLFVWLFIAVMGWVLIASAVAVGVEQGLRRYHGESKSVFEVGQDEQQAGSDETA
ncbi:MAG: hypothetical protein ABEH61_02700 [Haloarculaceae archaeon]